MPSAVFRFFEYEIPNFTIYLAGNAGLENVRKALRTAAYRRRDLVRYNLGAFLPRVIVQLSRLAPVEISAEREFRNADFRFSFQTDSHSIPQILVVSKDGKRLLHKPFFAWLGRTESARRPFTEHWRVQRNERLTKIERERKHMTNERGERIYSDLQHRLRDASLKEDLRIEKIREAAHMRAARRKNLRRIEIDFSEMHQKTEENR